MHCIAESMHLSEPTTKIGMKIYYQREMCRPMTLLNGDIRLVRIFEGVSWEGAVPPPQKIFCFVISKWHILVNSKVVNLKFFFSQQL